MSIGSENDVDELRDCSIVLAPYTGRRPDRRAPSACSARPGWTTSRRWPRWPRCRSSSAGSCSADLAHACRPLRAARRRPERHRRRDQARLPQARARAAPGHEPRQPGGRGAVQGDHRRVRDAARPRAPPPLRHVRRRRPGRRRPGPGRRGVRLRRPLRRVLLRWRSAAGACRPAARAGRRGGHGARPRPRPRSAPPSRSSSCSRARATAARARAASPARTRAAATRATARARCVRCAARSSASSSPPRRASRAAAPAPRIPNPCYECGGDGRVRATRHIEVEVPAGIDDGQRLRLTGRGPAAPRGGIPGDLYVTVRVRPHPSLERHGYDLVHQRRIAMTQAALGTVLDGRDARGARGGHGARRARSPVTCSGSRATASRCCKGAVAATCSCRSTSTCPRTSRPRRSSDLLAPVRRAARRGGRARCGGRVLLQDPLDVRRAVTDGLRRDARPRSAHVFVDDVGARRRPLGRRRRRPPPATRAPAARRRGGHRRATGTGAWRLCSIAEVGERPAPARAARDRSIHEPALTPRVVVAFAPAKGDQAGAVVHQLVELGVDAVMPVTLRALRRARGTGARRPRRGPGSRRVDRARPRCSRAAPGCPRSATAEPLGRARAATPASSWPDPGGRPAADIGRGDARRRVARRGRTGGRVRRRRSGRCSRRGPGSASVPTCYGR